MPSIIDRTANKTSYSRSMPASAALTCAVTLALLLLVLSGCTKSSQMSSDAPTEDTANVAVAQETSGHIDAPGASDRFYAIDAGKIDEWTIDDATIIVDRETGVEYLYIWNSSGYSGGSAITMLVNTDGTPKINAAWKLSHNNGDDADDADDTEE